MEEDKRVFHEVFKISKRGIVMKKIVVLLMFVKVLVASSLVVKDGNVTVSMGDMESTLPTDTTIELDKGTKVCYLSGNGRVTIDDISLSSLSTNKCYSTQKEKAFDLKKIIATYFKNTVVKLFQKNNENSGWTLFRGGKNEKVSGVITLQAGEEHLIIEGGEWSSYPITLTIYDTEGSEVNHITKYIDDYDDMMVFDIPRSSLEDKYKIVVRDNDGEEYINVGVELK